MTQILDHDGGLHHVSMEAGDILFYESAKLLHGRPRPLNGNHFANVGEGGREGFSMGEES